MENKEYGEILVLLDFMTQSCMKFRNDDIDVKLKTHSNNMVLVFTFCKDGVTETKIYYSTKN